MSPNASQITDPGPDPVTGVDPFPSLANAINNIKLAAQANCALLNASLKAIYLVQFDNWALNVRNGSFPNTNPPQPPMAYVPTLDPTTGFTFPGLGTIAVCAMPPIPSGPPVAAILVPDTISVGSHISSDATGKWFTVGPTDTFGAGLTTPPVTSADGILGTFERFVSPWGGWYFLTAKLG